MPTHGVRLEDACGDGEHQLIPNPTGPGRIHEYCGLSTQTIVDHLGHEIPNEP